MISASTSTISHDSSEAQTENPLRLSSAPEPDSATSSSYSAYSSVQQSAMTLVSLASDQASQRAVSTTITDRPSLPRQLLEARREHAIQRANAEQARRYAGSTRHTLEALLRYTLQPCFALDETNSIVRWNRAMSNWAGVAEPEAIGRALSSLFTAESAGVIEAASQDLRTAEEMRDEVDHDPVFTVEGPFLLQTGEHAVEISLLPLCRLPGIVESVLALVTPMPPHEPTYQGTDHAPL